MPRAPLLWLLASLLPASVTAQDVEVDGFTGLVIADGWEQVRANCIACHSPRLITQQRGTAAQWLSMIRWMQEKQNLWEMAPAVESAIVDYLATNYPPQADRRRAALQPDLMPPNPYAAGTITPKR
jgi:mono/diheme cytochrome c family protein